MYLNYDTATRIVTKRSDKHAGASLRNGYYLKFFPDLDAFIVQELDYQSKWTKTEDEKGGTHYTRAPKSSWTFRHRATLFRDGTVTLSSNLSSSFLWDKWHIRVFKSKTVAEQGYFAQRPNSEAVAIGVQGASFKLDANRGIVRLAPVTERVINKVLQKEIKAEIKRALRIITVREKLGAYAAITDTKSLNSFSLAAEPSNVRLAALMLHNASDDPGSKKEKILRESARALYQLVQNVDEGNLESANWLIKIALRHGRWHCYNTKENIAFCVKRFLNSRMRLIYLALGAETFVSKEC